MKEKYLRPTVVNAGNLDATIIESESVAPAVAAILGLMGAYALGRKITSAVKASPSFKLPSLTKFRSN